MQTSSEASELVSRVNAVTDELNSVLTLFQQTRNCEAKVTKDGRTYKVAYVLKRGENDWAVTKFISRGMFICNQCDVDHRYHNGDDWLQFTRDVNVVRLHSSLIHFFKEHPTHISQEVLELVAAVFID